MHGKITRLCGAVSSGNEPLEPKKRQLPCFSIKVPLKLSGKTAAAASAERAACTDTAIAGSSYRQNEFGSV